MGPTTVLPRGDVASSKGQQQRDRRAWWAMYAGTICVGLGAAAMAYRRSEQLYFGVALTVVLVLLAAWLRFPRVALAVTIAFALIGDTVTVAWFPFNKNLSSYESILYVTGSLSLSPLELSLAFGLVVTAYRTRATTGRLFAWTPLSTPLLIFLFLTFVGFVIGIARGGNLRIALIEARPVVYLPLLYLLVVNVCRKRRDYAWMFGAAIVGIEISVLLSISYYTNLSADVRSELGDLNEHGAAISMSLLLLMLITALAYRRVPAAVRIGLTVFALPTLFVYIVAQRRAAIVALGLALILFAVTLWWRQRHTFWKVVPIATIIIGGYIGAFWNSTSSAAFPAQAVKAVIAPDEASGADQSSDLYREIEKFNLHATIKSSPVTGIGFGHPFLRPIPLPHLPGFELQEFLPHNSLLWIWTKTGFFGFATLFMILGRTIALGASRVRSVRPGIDAVVAMSAVGFVAMFSIYLYVEVAWEPRNIVLLALAMGLCTGPLDDSRKRPMRSTSVSSIDQARSKPQVVSSAPRSAVGSSPTR